MNTLTRTIKPFDLKKFMYECCTTRQGATRSQVDRILIHGVDGRLLLAVPSDVDSGRDFFIVKLKGVNLIQPYMIVVRGRVPGQDFNRSMVMRYDTSLRNCESFLEGR